MHARVVTGHYRPEKLNELDQAADTFSSTRKSFPGYQHFISLFNPQTDEYIQVMLFEGEEHVQSSHAEHRKAAESIKQHLKDEPITATYEVRHFE